MFYPLEDKHLWAARYNIPIKSRPCNKCGKTLTADTPFAVKGWRGFTSKPHSCGEEYDLVVAVPATKQDKTELIRVFQDLKFQLYYGE